MLSLERPGCAHPLNIENEEEKGTILFAIQLTRIIVRAVEIEGFNTLQRSFNDLNKKDKDDTDTMLLTRQLGQLLFSLRLRIAWWAIFGDGSNNREFSGTDSTDRVTRLTHQLYCWYFVARKKLPSWKTPIPDRLKSVYPEIGLIVENLPKDDSMIGFDIWMQEGQALIHHAMATQNLAPYS